MIVHADLLQICLPLDWHVLVAACGFDQMAASREGEVIPGHQQAIRRGAIEQRLACRNRRVAVDIEGRLPIRVPGEDRRVLRRIAEHHKRLIAGDGKHSVARRVARRRMVAMPGATSAPVVSAPPSARRRRFAPLIRKYNGPC